MAEGDVFINDEKTPIPFPIDPETIIFNCEKLVIKPNEIITEWPDGFPVVFDKYKRLVFTNGRKRVTYSRLRVEDVE